MSIQNQMVNFSLLNKSGNFFSDQGFSGQANFPIKLFVLSCTSCRFFVESKRQIFSLQSEFPGSFRRAPPSGSVKSFLLLRFHLLGSQE